MKCFCGRCKIGCYDQARCMNCGWQFKYMCLACKCHLTLDNTCACANQPIGSIGFEWQCASARLRWKATNETVDSKCVATVLSTPGPFCKDVTVESDCSEVEYVSSPYLVFDISRLAISDVPQGTALFNTMVDLCGQHLQQVKRSSISKQTYSVIYTTDYKIQVSRNIKLPRGNREIVLKMNSEPESILGNAQVTIGLPLTKIVQFLDLDIGVPAYFVRCEPYQEYCKTNDCVPLFSNGGSSEAQSLYLLCAYYYYTLTTYVPKQSDDGPKQCLAFMVRNSFSSIFTSMSKEERRRFRCHVSYVLDHEPVSQTLMFPKGYTLGDAINMVEAKYSLTYAAKFTRSRSPKPVDRDRRKRSMAITENGPSRSVVRPVPSRSRADPGVIRGCPQA